MYIPYNAIIPLPSDDIRLVAFDADDTLWDNQSHFDETERSYAEILSPFCPAAEVSEALFDTESENMPLLGYGCKAFTLSMVETAVRVSRGRIAAADILRIVQLGKKMLSLPSAPLPGVEGTLRTLRRRGKYKLVVFTKGELLDQENKMERSGLMPLFDDVVVVSDKTRRDYLKLCDACDTHISRMVMVGNSFCSDIEPVLQLGGYAVHIPFHTTWKHEETQEYDHHRLRRLEHFAQLTALL